MGHAAYRVAAMFSIIIPTCNRADILQRSLACMLAMEGVEACEFIVIDDGSTDLTSALLEQYRLRDNLHLTVITQKNKGPGAARNAGLRVARMEYILFLDDDVFPDAALLRRHADFLAEGFDVSQGVLRWHPDVEKAPVIGFMESRGMQFGFAPVGNDREASFLNIYTANLALRRADALSSGGFDDVLTAKRYAYEDTAFAYTLARAGLRLGINSRAWAYHYHPMTEDGLVGREYKVGYATRVLKIHYPEIAGALNIERIVAYMELQRPVLALLLRLPGIARLVGYEMYLRLRCRDAFLRGYAECLQSENDS